jgi:hypothetical protein
LRRNTRYASPGIALRGKVTDTPSPVSQIAIQIAREEFFYRSGEIA